MNNFIPTSTAIALALCLSGLGITTAQAQAPAPRAGDTDGKELAAARADLAQAAKRVAELSRTDAPQVRVERRVVGRPVIGVLLTPDERAGVRIAGVTPGSGAAKAGLKSGDRIVSVDGRQVLGSSGELRLKNLRKLLGEMDGKSPTKIGYARDGRTATVAVTPQAERHLFVWNDGDGKLMKGGGEGGMFAVDPDDFDFDFDVDAAMAGIAPEIHREIARIDSACKGGGCRAPMLLSAFRWNGLNLAAVDAQLGRYFGTDHGVLVLSSGELKELQAGDVIQRIDGKPVGDPGAAMATLRGKDDGAKVAVDYLRDRRNGKTEVTVPKLMALPIPPAPPAPPAPPSAPKARPAPPAPPKAPSAPKTAAAPPVPHALAPVVPPAPPAPPPPALPDPAMAGFAFSSDDGRVVSFATQVNDPARGRVD